MPEVTEKPLENPEDLYDVIQEAAKKPSADATGTGKTFAVSPDGFVVHFDIEGRASALLGNMNILLAALKAEGWTPHEGWGVAPAKADDPNAEKCPECGVAMVIKQGISKKTNKAYKCWSCPKNKNHPPIWVNDDD